MKPALVPSRLRPQRLVGAPAARPEDVVRHLGAVQSQDHGMSMWSIARRCGATRSEVETAFERGAFVRTHVLRPTWHHVLRDDLGDLLAVTAPRIERLIATGNRTIGLTDARLLAGADVVTQAVAASGPLTRAEVAEHLGAAGFEHAGLHLVHTVMQAEISGGIHSGPPRGKQHTYVAADLPSSGRTSQERLAWMARTYARGHGPFRDRDLAWWTSLTLTDARRAIELAELRPVELGGETHHVDDEPRSDDVPAALLLSNFDELISYARDPADLAPLGPHRDRVLRSGGLLLVDGALAGSWRRTVHRSTVDIEVRPLVAPTRRVRASVEQEADHFGRFSERVPTLSIVF